MLRQYPSKLWPALTAGSRVAFFGVSRSPSFVNLPDPLLLDPAQHECSIGSLMSSPERTVMGSYLNEPEPRLEVDHRSAREC
jgi:hypothetical protein